jgi:hypothetical protein
MDPSLRLWNFTRLSVGEVVEAGREMAVEYRLAVPRMEESSSVLRLVAVVQYADTARAARWAVATAFNASLTFVANPLPFDSRVYLPYVLATLVLIGASQVFREFVTKPRGIAVRGADLSKGGDAADDEPEVSVVPDGRQRRKQKA